MSSDRSELEAAYRAPAVDLDDDERRVDGEHDGPRLYVIGVPKLMLLYVATVGIYAIYWFYRHFSVRKRYDQPQSWPLARAFFAVFYVHRLFRFIDTQARAAGQLPSWNPNALATLYVLVVIGARLISRFVSLQVGMPAFVISTVIALAGVISLATAQGVANRASGDPEGKANAGVDVGSVLFGLLGIGAWALIIRLILLVKALQDSAAELGQ